MKESDDDIFVPEEKKKEFINWTQNLCWFNWEVTLRNPNLTEDQRLDRIETEMELGLLCEEDLDGAIDSKWLEIVLDKTSKHNTEDHWFFTGSDISDVINTVVRRMASDSAEELVKNDEADLYWDTERNDFIIKMKES